MIQILLFIAKYFWIAFIGIILIIAYILWAKDVIHDCKYCLDIFQEPFEHLETESKIFLAIHILIPILASFIYFLYSTDIWRIKE